MDSQAAAFRRGVSVWSLVCAIALVCLARDPAAGQTALEHLKASAKPVFRQGHTLLPLTRWGWTMPYDVRVELCENWGYALEFGADVTPGVAGALENPESEASRLCTLAASDPKRYPLSVIVYRPLLDSAFVAGLPDATWCHDAKGELFDAPQWKTWNPLAPNETFERAAARMAGVLKTIQAKAPIAIVLNGGEYGLNVFGHSGPVWQQDPKLVAAKGDKDWYTFVSEQKARQETIIAEAIRKEVPGRKLSLWYHFGGMPTWSPWQWSWKYEPMRTVSDMLGQSIYYKQFNSGWTGESDLLTNVLHAYTQAAPHGDTLGYHWVCGGWLEGKFSESDRYMGFLKCLYTSGMVGAVAGYFSYPKPGFAENLGPEIPSWLWQMMHLARAQALFSHLEEFIREGDLLPGPNKHARLKDLPAYEFPTGQENVRVLVRKHRKRSEWLIAAWAADGPQKEVTVEVPGLGMATVLARPCGSVYRATSQVKMEHEPPEVTLVLVDTDGMLPSAGFAKPVPAAK